MWCSSFPISAAATLATFRCDSTSLGPDGRIHRSACDYLCRLAKSWSGAPTPCPNGRRVKNVRLEWSQLRLDSRPRERRRRQASIARDRARSESLTSARPAPARAEESDRVGAERSSVSVSWSSADCDFGSTDPGRSRPTRIPRPAPRARSRPGSSSDPRWRPRVPAVHAQTHRVGRPKGPRRGVDQGRLRQAPVKVVIAPACPRSRAFAQLAWRAWRHRPDQG